MKILFIGGTGTISSACAQLALARGFELTLLNRGRQPAWPGARQIIADISDVAATAAALGGEHWDAVVDYIAYTPEELEQRIALFRGRTAQFIFISSASAYQKPSVHFPITESTPLANPFWDYAQKKIACEEILMRALQTENFPATIIRPSWTYNGTRITVPVNSKKSFTLVDRLRRGQPVIVPGDGSAFWTMTHSTDFAKGLVGLLGHQGAIGHAFHIASDFITACLPEFAGGLHGDKAVSSVFDNTKIKRFVPDYVATTRFRDGITRTVKWFDADPARQLIDAEANAAWDKLIAAYERGLESARREFGR